MCRLYIIGMFVQHKTEHRKVQKSRSFVVTEGGEKWILYREDVRRVRWQNLHPLGVDLQKNQNAQNRTDETNEHR